ncbi:MAG: SPFH/Band 7/PHB domain protein [Chloroflexi bacterium]|nr:SPFH/Band 7/PHB domain protein [Chloroflexota bacterium]
MALALEADKKELNRQGLIIKVIVGLFAFALCLLLKLGWKVQYTVILATLAWAVFSFPREFWRLLLIGWLVLGIALVSSAHIQNFMAINARASRLIKDVTAQDVLSFILGLILGLVVVGVPLFIVLFVSSEYVLALHEIAGVSRRHAIKLLWSLIMGIQLPWLIVENGEVTESKPKGVLPEIGGPGVVVIRPGNAVVSERHGKVTRIAGPGIVKTKRFEKIREVIDLRPQWATIEAENVLTKDRVPLAIKYGVGYQIEPKSDTDERLESVLKGDGEALTEEIGEVYPVYAATVRKAVFNVTPAGWQLTVSMAAGSFLRDTVATLNFDEIFELVEDIEEPMVENRRRIHEIEQRVQDKLAQVALNWGIKIKTFDVESIEIPAEARARMLEWWEAEWKRRIAFKRARSERQTMIEKATGRAWALEKLEEVKADARRRMIRQLINAIEGVDQIGGGKTTIRFIHVIEQLSRRMMTDDIIASHYCEVLEAIVESGGQKVFVLGEDRRLLEREDGTLRGLLEAGILKTLEPPGGSDGTTGILIPGAQQK